MIFKPDSSNYSFDEIFSCTILMVRKLRKAKVVSGYFFDCAGSGSGQEISDPFIWKKVTEGEKFADLSFSVRERGWLGQIDFLLDKCLTQRALLSPTVNRIDYWY